jgi:hypothetical protein
MSVPKKKILIVEDHPLFRAMLVQLISQELGMARDRSGQYRRARRLLPQHLSAVPQSWQRPATTSAGPDSWAGTRTASESKSNSGGGKVSNNPANQRAASGNGGRFFLTKNTGHDFKIGV